MLRLSHIYKIILPAVFLLAAAMQVSAAPAMYTVDYKLLLALHPRMALYDMVIERFIRNDIVLNQDSTAKIQRDIAVISERAGRDLQPVYAETEKLNREIERLLLGTGLNAASLKDLSRQNNGVTGRDAQLRKLGSLNKRLDELNRYIEAKQDEVLSPMYLSKAQTKAQVEAVLEEIDSLLNTFSRQLGGALIIDSDYTAVQYAPARLTSAPVSGVDPLSLVIYQQVLSGGRMAEITEFYRNSAETQNMLAAARAYSDASINNDIGDQISRSQLLSKTTGFHGRLVLAGGENIDLTRQVLERLFQRYSIRSDISLRILNLVK